MTAIKEYIDEKGRIPFAKWFGRLNAQAAAKIATALLRVEHDNFSNTRSIGSGVYEYKIDYGPGYRVYFGKDGKNLVILLGGGTKKRQQNDIGKAKELWKNYKKRKKKER